MVPVKHVRVRDMWKMVERGGGIAEGVTGNEEHICGGRMKSRGCVRGRRPLPNGSLWWIFL